MRFTFYILWFLFYLGFATSLLLQAQTSVSSDSNNLQNLRQWISIHWRVIWANLFLSTALSAAIFHLIPASAGLSEFSRYAMAGFISNSVLDKLLFIFGQLIGTRIEVPKIAPPANGDPAKRWP
jgi:hypothetical protein